MDIEGAIDEGALSEYAADNLDETWAQVVRDAVSECVAAVSGQLCLLICHLCIVIFFRPKHTPIE
jgi:hypothetical protein